MHKLKIQWATVAMIAALFVLSLFLSDGVHTRLHAQSLVSDAGERDSEHKSLITIRPSHNYPIVRKLKIGLDKSMLVELPVELRDVLVSNPEVVDAVVKSTNKVYLLAKNVGEANAFFFDADGRKILFLDISVSRDMSTLRDTLHRLIPGSEINVEPMGDNVVLTGHVANPVDASRAAELASRYVKKKDGVVNMLAVDAKEQVLLKVTVAEMQRDAIRRLGVNLPGGVVGAGNLTFTKVMQNAFPITSATVPAAVGFANGSLPAVAAGNVLQGNYRSGSHNVTALVQALERTGLMKTLAEPNLTAISGETAKFLAGGEFPVPVAGQEQQVTVQWKSFGVGVTFKPVVMTEGRISLKIAAEVSELSNEGAVTINQIALPGLKVRRAETTLELPSGGTLAMAGLLSDETRKNVEGVPGLKNMPILGALFRSTDYQKRETELVILVTPYIARNGTAKQETGRPDKGFSSEPELRELFLGRINRVYGHPATARRDERDGDYGFIIDYPNLGAKG